MGSKLSNNGARRANTNGHQHRAATAADILGRSAKGDNGSTAVEDSPWAAHHRKLLQLRRQLVDGIGESTASSRFQPQGFSMHMADSGTESFDRDFTLSILQSERDALYEIDQALGRIRNGTYGVCEMTGKPISKARLWSVPWARYSMEAQRELESYGMIARPHLAELTPIQHYEGNQGEG